jgi:hypothetical protein
MLALSFLMLIGMMLIADGAGFHVPKNYIYAAIGFSIVVEALNQWAARRRQTLGGGPDPILPFSSSRRERSPGKSGILTVGRRFVGINDYRCFHYLTTGRPPLTAGVGPEGVCQGDRMTFPALQLGGRERRSGSE